jgi:hypothetical protein
MDYGFLWFPWKLVSKPCSNLHFLIKGIASARKLKKTLAMKFEPAQISRKSSQANESQRKLVVKQGSTKCKLKLAMTCVLD